MKFSINKLTTTLLTAGAILIGAAESQADVTVKVDSTKNWQGFNNVTQTNGFASYVFGSAWATADLRARFIPTNSPSGWPFSTVGVMSPNTNTYNPTNVFWNNPDGTCNKLIEANWYVDVGTAFAGQTVTFQGTVISNSVPLADTAGLPTVTPASSWHVIAFIKDFNTSYGGLQIVTTTNLAPGPFTLTHTFAANRVCQYGFLIFGPNTAPGSPNSLAGLGVVVEDADPAITNQPVNRTVTTGTSVSLTVGAVGSSALSYQWKCYGTNLSDGGNISGVNTTNLVISNAQTTNSGPYTVTVSDTAGSVDSRTAQVTVLDVVIVTGPQSQRVEQGSTVVFNVNATSSSPLTYQWKSVIGGVTNNLVNGPNVSGATTNTLTLSNVQVTNSGTYLVRLSTTGGSADAGATLVVKSYADYANFVENPGFENDTNGVNESPWIRFQATDPSFGAFQDTNDSYFLGGNVNVYAGTYVSYTAFAAEYSGIYQDVPASPGQIFAADMWFYNASGDPIPGPSTSSTNESFIEIQFRNNPNGTPLQQYISPFMTYATPQNVWFNLQATNGGGYGTLPTPATAKYLVAPPGATFVRFQVTMHDIAGSSGYGSLYYDNASLMLKIPVSVTATRSGGNVNLSWKSQGATSYQVQYKDDLTEATWTDLEVVAGNGIVVVKSYPTSGSKRFYRVLTL